MGITRACGLVGISRSLFAYESMRTGDALTERMKEMAALKRRYGYRRIHILLRREGWQTNHKRVWWLYSQAGLSVRKRRRKRIAPAERVVRPVATAPNQSWSMDFVSDGLAYGRRFRCLSISMTTRARVLPSRSIHHCRDCGWRRCCNGLQNCVGCPNPSPWTTARSLPAGPWTLGPIRSA